MKITRQSAIKMICLWVEHVTPEDLKTFTNEDLSKTLSNLYLIPVKIGDYK